MCGIVGYTGFKNAVNVVYDGLKTLEYRGYDSAGIAIENGKIEIYKSTGRVSSLKAILPVTLSHTAIGHTRWATHGKPDERNAHPHISFDGKIAVVHNGIIENCKQLRAMLEQKGIQFASDTDSEIIAHFLALENRPNFAESVRIVGDMLDGAATFLAIREGDDKIYCKKAGTSLSVGVGDGENFVASDTLAVCKHTKRVIALEDGDVAVVSKSGVVIKNNGKIVIREPIDANRTPIADSTCFMKSEIEEIPIAAARTFDAFFCKDNAKAETKLKDADKILFVGCGTAYHACLYAKILFSKLLKKHCDAVCASEFDGALVDKGTACVFISQSGETADTVLAAKTCKKAGGYTIAICNVQNSLLARTTDAVYYLEAGAEVAVAATKSYVCQILDLYLLATKCAAVQLPFDFQNKLKDCLQTAVELDVFTSLAKGKNIFFIGKGLDMVTANEAALKVKEITYKMTDAYPAGELKHGPIALIDDNSLVFVVATNIADKRRIEATTNELISRGATVYAISSIGDFGANKTTLLPTFQDENLSPLVAIVPLQNFALSLSLALNLNPDKPRNLAKSVTVI